jgi:hypothetical protein
LPGWASSKVPSSGGFMFVKIASVMRVRAAGAIAFEVTP